MATALKKAVRKRNRYVMSCGGYQNIREADQTYNDLNRAVIAAMAEDNGTAFLGSIQYYGASRRNIASGTDPVFVQYVGQVVQNFDYDYVVSSKDPELENMVREFNQPGKPMDHELLDRIFNKLDTLKGCLLLWT